MADSRKLDLIFKDSKKATKNEHPHPQSPYGRGYGQERYRTGSCGPIRFKMSDRSYRT
jgi:hypothetical protein